MKKTIKTILCTLALAVLAVSCQKEINEVEPNTKNTIEISINGLMGEYTQVDATKSSLVNTVRVSWENGDIVYVYDGTQCIGSLVASIDGTEDRYAILSTDENHTVTAPAAGTKLTLVHSPLLTEAPAVSEGAISISLATQNSTKAPFVAYATLDYNNEESINNAIVPFKFATSVIKVNCTGLYANTTIDNATLSNVNTACKLTLSGTAAPTVAGDANGTITRTGDDYFAASKVNAEGEAVFQIAVPKLETASGARVLTVAQSSYEVKDKKFTTKSLNPATSVNTVCQLVGLPVGALKGEFTVSDDGGATTKQIYFSKGNLWADGSNALFFEDAQWKSTPASDDVKDAGHISHFTWSSTVAVAVSESYNGDYLFTNVDGFKVNVDGKEQTGWRTLSTKEWQYLFNTRSNASNLYKCGVTVCGKTNCVVLLPDNWEWDETADEHNVGTGWQDEGYPETQTGNEVTWEKMEKAGAVCLPAAGSRAGSSVGIVGDRGYYWSSTANDGNDAYYVGFSSSTVAPVHTGLRYYGYSVRLITESK